jgi:hypothetical protein
VDKNRSKEPQRVNKPAPLDIVKFNVEMNRHAHAMQQCLVDLALAVGRCVGLQRLHHEMEAQINDFSTSRTDLSDAWLAAASTALKQHAERTNPSRT